MFDDQRNQPVLDAETDLSFMRLEMSFVVIANICLRRICGPENHVRLSNTTR